MKQKLWLTLITCWADCIDKELYKAIDYLKPLMGESDKCPASVALSGVNYKFSTILAILCECRTHAILPVNTIRGPGVDINQFGKILKLAAEKLLIDQVLADAGYDGFPRALGLYYALLLLT